MSNILVNSIEELENIENLLNTSLPSYRQAYSDRTAWLLACISELAYIKFNPIFTGSNQEKVIKTLSEIVEENKIKSLNRLLNLVGYDPEVEREKLIENVDFLKLKLIKTFDTNGTQAILLSNDHYLFLGFRGTEPSSVKDIKADANAIVRKCETGGRIHSGFDDAFNQVSVEIQQFLNQDEFKSIPLFITGHSLGGALATVATKKLKHSGGIAACYTFGSPRVGDINWTSNIKNPIYRLVNSADPVTMLPPSDDLISASAWSIGLLPVVGKTIKELLLSKFGGYLHVGDMRYLSNCRQSDYTHVKLLYSVSLFFRLKAYVTKTMSFSKVPSDHSITVYRQKLKIIALQKNIEAINSVTKEPL